jgi:WD40 repeat protein
LDVETGKTLWSASPKGGAFCVAWSPDGSRLAAGNDSDGTVTIWDTDGKNERIAWKPSRIGEGGTVTQLAWSNDGKRIVSRSSGVIHVWEVVTGRELALYVDHEYWRRLEAAKGRAVVTMVNDGFHYWPRLSFSPDDRSVLVAGRELRGLGNDYVEDIWVWDLEANRECRSLARVSTCCTFGLARVRGTRQLITLNSSIPYEERIKHPQFVYAVYGWDYESGRQLWAGATVLEPNQGEPSILYLNAISPDGRRVTLFWNAHTPAPDSGRVTIFELPQSSP